MEALGSMAGLAAGGLALFGLAWAFAARARRRRIARGATPARGEAASAGGADFAPVAHRLEARMAAIEDGQAQLAARLDGAGGAEDRLQATAAQLLGLIRDKNATLETALAGLDQLRTRMRTLEQIGDAAEARGLFDRLGERLDALESAQATAAAALDGRLAGLAAQGDVAPIVEKLTALHAQKDAAAEAALGRLGPLEARLAKLEGAAPGEAVARLATRLEALAAAQGATQAALAGLKAEAGPVAELAERLSRLHAQKEALAERLLARLDALEAETAGRDPGPALAALAARIGALEASGTARWPSSARSWPGCMPRRTRRSRRCSTACSRSRPGCRRPRPPPSPIRPRRWRRWPSGSRRRRRRAPRPRPGCRAGWRRSKRPAARWPSSASGWPSCRRARRRR